VKRNRLNKWAGLAVPHYATGVWIVFRPMEMRGMTSGPMPEMQAPHVGPNARHSTLRMMKKQRSKLIAQLWRLKLMLVAAPLALNSRAQADGGAVVKRLNGAAVRINN
jgi:hypothetical protein